MSKRSLARVKKRADAEDNQYRVRVLNIGGRKAADDGTPAGVSQAIVDDPFQASGMYGAGGRRLVLPPLGEGSLRMMTEYVDESSILAQCINAYQVNIDGFGHRWDAWQVQEPGEEVASAMASEAERLDEWMEYAWHGGPLLKLRQQMRYDRESTGIGYIEGIRNLEGALAGLNHLPSWTMRMTAVDPEWVEVQEWRRVQGAWVQVPVMRRFRLYLQIVIAGGRFLKTWYKEWGDPRKLSRLTGQWLTEGTRSQHEATEVLAFPRFHPVSPYGLPRWIGNLPSVIGVRAAEEVNVLYFDNKTVPPLIVAVSGGQLTKASYRRLEEALEGIKGRENFHRALLIEALPADQVQNAGRSRPAIEIRPMTDRMTSDAMFMNYDVAGRAKQRGSFRLPPILVGETTDYNRSTAEISLMMADAQVFTPERQEYDGTWNRRVIPEFQPQYCKFASLGPNVTLNEDLVALLQSAESTGGMTPNIARKIIGDVMQVDVPLIAEEWGNLPFTMGLRQMDQEAAQIAADAAAAAAQSEPGVPASEPAKAAVKTAVGQAMRLLSAQVSPAVKAVVIRELRADLARARALKG